MKQLPIRLRLTLWYSIMFAAAALLLSAMSWWMLRSTIDATIHQDLQERIDDVRTQLQQTAPQVAQADLIATFDATYRHRDDGKWLQVLSQNGVWIYRSRRMADQSMLSSMPEAPPSGGVQFEFQHEGRTVRVLSSRIVAHGRSYSVQAGISMAKSQLLLHDFRLGLLLMTPAVLLIAAGAGHFMSRRALLPVALIAYEARRITDRNLDSRLPVSASDDELSHLSITLNHMLARIDSSFRSVREFTANASHELRTPLARIRTEAEVALLRPRQVEDYRQSLAQIHDDAIEMSGLIENLLTLARADAGSEILRLVPVDLHALVSEVADEWSMIAVRLSLRLTSQPGAEKGRTDSMVLADRPALLRLLRIWLDNACKFTPPGGSITILTEMRDDDVLLSVQDSGIGIAPEQHGRIFERFYRIDHEHSSRAVGAGLGLSLAAWIAEQHKTRILLESVPGQGARFQVTLRRTERGSSSQAPKAHQKISQANAMSGAIRKS